MTSKEFRRAWQFFHRNAGGIVGQSTLTAWKLAKAEERLREAVDNETARVLWEGEECPDTSWMDRRATEQMKREAITCQYCVVQTRCCACKQWETKASLGDIWSTFDAYDTYPRIVEAELALQAFDN